MREANTKMVSLSPLHVSPSLSLTCSLSKSLSAHFDFLIGISLPIPLPCPPYAVLPWVSNQAEMLAKAVEVVIGSWRSGLFFKDK